MTPIPSARSDPLTEVVNLRLARKRKARESSEQVASQRRAAFGRTKAEKELESLKRDIEGRALDGHRRIPADES